MRVCVCRTVWYASTSPAGTKGMWGRAVGAGGARQHSLCGRGGGCVVGCGGVWGGGGGGGVWVGCGVGVCRTPAHVHQVEPGRST